MKPEKKELLRSLGHNKFIDNVDLGLCPFCGKPVNSSDFEDECSRREFEISGLCNACQDDFFKDYE